MTSQDYIRIVRYLLCKIGKMNKLPITPNDTNFDPLEIMLHELSNDCKNAKNVLNLRHKTGPGLTIGLALLVYSPFNLYNRTPPHPTPTPPWAAGRCLKFHGKILVK